MTMRILFILLCVATFIGCSDSNPSTGNREDGLRLASYNIRNGKGLDNKRNLDRTAEVIRSLSAEVVALQEVDNKTARSGGVDVAAYLAEKCEMHATFGRAIEFDGGGYGVALLSREKPLSVKQVALAGREEKRTMLAVELKNFWVISTHLSLTEEDRMASIEPIAQFVEQCDKPVFIMGDWNAEPGSEFITQMAKRLNIVNDTKRFTFPADKPNCCIDYIAVDRKTKLRIKHFEVVNEPVASDHRPLLVEVDF